MLRRKRKRGSGTKDRKDTHLAKKIQFGSFDNCDNNGDVHQQILDSSKREKNFSCREEI